MSTGVSYRSDVSIGMLVKIRRTLRMDVGDMLEITQEESAT